MKRNTNLIKEYKTYFSMNGKTNQILDGKQYNKNYVSKTNVWA